MDFAGQFAVFRSLLAFGRVFDNSLAAQFGMLHDVGARHKMDELGVQALGQRIGQIILTVGLTFVADQPAQTHAARMCIFENTLGDVVGGIQRHHFAGHDNVDFLRLVFADWHSKPAAHHVTQHVVGNVVYIIIGTIFFQEVDGRNNPTPSAAHAWFWTTGFNAFDAVVTNFENVFELKVLHGTRFGGKAENRVLCLGVQNQTRGVSLGITPNDQDLLPHLNESGERILGSGRFSDPSLAIKGDLAKLTHDFGPVLMELPVSDNASDTPCNLANTVPNAPRHGPEKLK